ncbi:MAG: transposase, partial [Epsilonproteobacteria bacterium]|nr:transposase [Campylobacterota bacterium]
MLYIRVIKTASDSRAVQIVYYRNRKRIIFKHIGSGKTDEEIASLKAVAQDIIENTSLILPFHEEFKFNNLLYINKSEFLGVYYSFFYEIISSLLNKIGLSKINSALLLDLVIIRIFEPTSKLQSIDLLELYFGIKHRRQSYYESAPKWLDIKGKVDEIAINFAKKQYSFSFDLLFYDVTTLYFETFEEDELRKNGFSKDNKSQQPQILIALMVTKEGFPITYEVFSGNTFEGQTILPVVKSFVKKNNVRELTDVVDTHF